MSPARRRILASIVAIFVIVGVAVALTVRAAHARDALMRADPETILADSRLARTARSLGRKGFVAHCAGCHGDGRGDPGRGMPDLTDGDFLYGSGQVAEIEQIVLHGIRSGDPRGWNLASMPAYAQPKPYAAEPIPPLSPGEIQDATQFVLGRRGGAADLAAAARGASIYAGRGGCWDCHGSDGGGDDAIGAPNLLDDVWLYGGSRDSIPRSITQGRAGVSPAFARLLSASDARAIAVYVASLSRHRSEDASRER